MTSNHEDAVFRHQKRMKPAITIAELQAKGYIVEGGRAFRSSVITPVADQQLTLAPVRTIEDKRSGAEKRYEVELESNRIVGRIRWWRRCRVRLILMPSLSGLRGVTYTPDYEVMDVNGTYELHEVKGGHCWEDAWIKFKMAVEQNQHIRFVFARWDGHEWTINRYQGKMDDQ